MNKRFTIDGSDAPGTTGSIPFGREVGQTVATDCFPPSKIGRSGPRRRLRSRRRRRIEDGTLGDEPYNDLEFYVFLARQSAAE